MSLRGNASCIESNYAYVVKYRKTHLLCIHLSFLNQGACNQEPMCKQTKGFLSRTTFLSPSEGSCRRQKWAITWRSQACAFMRLRIHLHHSVCGRILHRNCICMIHDQLTSSMHPQLLHGPVQSFNQSDWCMKLAEYLIRSQIHQIFLKTPKCQPCTAVERFSSWNCHSQPRFQATRALIQREGVPTSWLGVIEACIPSVYACIVSLGKCSCYALAPLPKARPV
jgi:hypothetical protein